MAKETLVVLEGGKSTEQLFLNTEWHLVFELRYGKTIFNYGSIL
jgi:hypothetical protein